MPNNLDLIGKQYAELLRYEALNFVQGNADVAAALGKDTLNAIFQSAFWVQPLPIVTPDMGPEQLADVEEALGARDRIFQLVAKAEKDNAAAAKRLKKAALDAAGRIGNTILSIGASALTSQLTAIITKV